MKESQKNLKKGFLKCAIHKKHGKFLSEAEIMKMNPDWRRGYNLFLKSENGEAITESEIKDFSSSLFEFYNPRVDLDGVADKVSQGKNPIKTSEFPSYRFGYIEKAPIEDIFWKPSTRKELAEGLATLAYNLPKRVIPFFWKELTRGKLDYPKEPELLREYVDFMWGVGFKPEPTFDADKEYARLTGKDLPRDPVSDKMTPYMRDPRVEMFKKSNIPVPAVTSLPKWEEAGTPVTQEDLILLSYSYGLDQTPDKIATVWDTAFYLVGDIVNVPDWIFDPAYATDPKTIEDVMGGSTIYSTYPEGSKTSTTKFGAIYASNEGKK